MPPTDQEVLASRFVNSTARHVFLTGKAGTGKTTFLKKIVAQTHKKHIVAAPTGIAAINAGGITLHSLFHLPFGSFVPSDSSLAHLTVSTSIKTPRSLLRDTRFFDAKRKLLRELELLIIDEVSMLRADLLDAIDVILRHIRRKQAIPFGGVQMLFIGDLLQLPPVVKDDEWNLLRQFYPSLFFFHAKALTNNPPLYIELEHIYRQQDPHFIGLLNKVRDNQITREDTALLNQYVNQSFDPASEDGCIFLTTHNHKADQTNCNAISKIKKSEYTYDAIVEGDFGERLYPVEYTLRLKKGAQVMFVKNDHSGEQRYFNGKIGRVESLGKDHISVRFNDGSPSTTVDRYTWENKKYRVNPENNDIEEQRIGTFSHFPIKLAWAITVHKSQGLTFNKAVIDVSDAFAPGQIYVALSRLRSLDGLILKGAVPEKLPVQDPHLQTFSADKPAQDDLLMYLKTDSDQFIQQELKRTFDFSGLTDMLRWHMHSYNKEEGRSVKQQFRKWAQTLQSDFYVLRATADRFLNQLKRLMKTDDTGLLQERLKKAGNYFQPELIAFSKRILDHMVAVGELKGVKKYTGELRDLESAFFARLQMIRKTEALVSAILKNNEPNRENTSSISLTKERNKMLQGEIKKIFRKEVPGKSRLKKGATKGAKDKRQGVSSAEASYQLHQEGKSIEEIAQIRDLAPSTIMSHMVKNIENGLLDARVFIEEEKMEQIIAASKIVKSTRASDIMPLLGDEFSYNDVHMAMAAVKSP